MLESQASPLVNFLKPEMLLSFLSVLAAIAGILSVNWYWDYERIERSKAFREERLSDLGEVGENYIKLLGNVLGVCDKVWGPLNSFRPLGISVVLAVFYSLFIFVAAWTFGGSGSIGSTTLLGELPQEKRYEFSGTLVVLSFFIIMGIVFSEQIQNSSIEKIRKILHSILSALKHGRKGKKHGDYSEFARFIFYIFGCSFIFVVFLVPPYIHSGLKVFQIYLILGLSMPFVATILVGYRFERVVPVLVAVSLIAAVLAYTPLFYGDTVPSTFAIISAVGFAGAFILGRTEKQPTEQPNSERFTRGSRFATGITGSIGGAFVGYLAVGTKDFLRPFGDPSIVSILLFLIFLPLINGLVDWGSLSVSRLLGKKLNSRLMDSNPMLTARIGTILIFVIVDIGIAILLLCIMTVGLTGIIQIYNRSALEVLLVAPLGLEQLISDVKNAPLGSNGIWVTSMLFSTLIPTFAHFIFVLFASFVTWRPSPNALIDLANEFSLDEFPPEESIRKIRAYRKLARFLTMRRITRLSVGLVLFLILLFGVLYAIEISFHNTVAESLESIALGVLNYINH